jgi:mannose-6-phosphate isomerase-like protein (cupin superfamily)
MTVVNRLSAEHYVWGTMCDGWRLLDRPDLAVIEERIPSGAGEVRHLHRRARQMFVVLSGSLQIELDGGTETLASGDALEVPPGVPHRVWNRSHEDARFLVISAPTTRGDREDLQNRA